MLVKFKQAVRLPPGPKGKDYSRGIHEVPQEAYSHPFFQKLIVAGLVEDGESKKVDILTERERAQKLMDKVVAPKQPKSKASAVTSPPQAPSEKPAAAAEASQAPVAPPADEQLPPAPPAKSEEELMADLEAEEAEKKLKAEDDAKLAAAKAKHPATKNKQHK